MATRKSTTTAIATWDEELAKQAAIAAATEASTASGNFFSVKGGALSFNDAPMPRNQMGVVILDYVLENVYYEGRYDPEEIQSPTCFAFGRDDKTMSPHQQVIDAGNSQAGASGLCAGCPMNEWGSSDIGRGKACRNSRRLAMIPAGTFDEHDRFKAFTDPEQFETAPIGYLKVPVTSVKGFSAFVKQIAGALKRPPHGIFTKVSVRPDPQTQLKVLFEPIAQVPNNLFEVIMRRHDEAKNSIEFPYSPPEERQQAPARGNRKPPSKTTAKGKRY